MLIRAGHYIFNCQPLCLIKHCTTSDAKFIHAFYSKDRYKRVKDERDQIISLMRQYGSIEYAASAAREYSKIAIERFESYAKGLPGIKARQIIHSGIDFVTMRNK